ncbi:PAS domain-containing sensor histidine kinase [Niveispirillum irakense]|uniref:sensor histidine kinase n=1 Tax=Niveispirillum irakense TaxID=34011 RepID=UPI0013789378|nr:PAS domain-containing sensor histidine kinase [Niveispirillum irakense]
MPPLPPSAMLPPADMAAFHNLQGGHASALGARGFPTLLMVGGMMAMVGLLILLVAWSGRGSDHEAAVRVQEGVRAALSAMEGDLASTVGEHAALLDQAQGVPRWLGRNGDTVLVMDVAGQFRLGFRDGKPLADSDLRDLSSVAEISRLATHVRSVTANTGQPVTGGLIFQDSYHLVGAAGFDDAEGQGAVLLLRRLDTAAARQSLVPLSLTEVAVTAADPVGGAVGRIALPVALGDGTVQGWLVWQAPTPVGDYLARLAWLLLPLLLVGLGAGGLMVGRFRQRARHHAIMADRLEHIAAAYRLLVDGLPDLVCLLRDGRIVLVNQVGAALLGAKDGRELTGRFFADLLPPSARLTFQRRVQGSGPVADGSVWDATELAGAGGEPMPVELALCRLEPSGRDLIIVARDRREHMTNRAQVQAAEVRAAMADRARGRFLANISHELRTPLNAIIGFSEILRDELLGGLGAPQYREYAIDIHEGGLHLLRLINDLLDIARMDAGELELREGWVDMSALVERCDRLLSQKATAKQVRVSTRVNPAGLRLLVDEVRIKQLLVHLWSNAIRFSAEEGAVAIEVGEDQESGDVVITIADKGIGMDVAAMRLALEPFGQVEDGHARRQPGAGLGLPLARGYAEAHGGSLQMESSPGVGTTVRVRLPADRVQRPPSPPQARPGTVA